MSHVCIFNEEFGALENVGIPFGSGLRGDAPGIIFDTMKYVFKMDVTDLGGMNILEKDVGTQEGLKAGQDYGRAVAEKLN